MQFLKRGHNRKTNWLQGLLYSLTLAWGMGISSASAAQTVTIRLGPFEQTIAIAELEKFAKTGKLPASLQAFSPLLTPQTRELLQQRLQVDPAFADKFVDGLMRSPGGKQLLSSLRTAIPGSSTETLQAAFNLALRQVNGLTLLGFLQAYPQENITVDASSAASVALQFNPSYLQSQALGSLLKRNLPVSSASFPKNFQPSAPGKQAVQSQSIVLQDKQRGRKIPVDIYTSNGDSQQPLVVISHGFGASRRFSRYLAVHLASHGLTVAAIEHPGSNGVAVGKAADNAELEKLLPATEFIDRPQDISFLLDELAKLNVQPGQLRGKFNTEKVSVIGHSLGGYTALAVVGGELNLGELRQFCKQSLSIAAAPGDLLQCAAASLPQKQLRLGDERVKSAIALNPLVGKLFGQNGLSQVKKPVLILTGTEDSVTPSLSHQLVPFTQLQGTKYLLTAIGGTHLSITDPSYRASTVTTVVKEKQGSQTTQLRELLQGVSLAFIKQLTPEAKNYQLYLTPAYAQSFSQPQLELRLNSELPPNIQKWVQKVKKG